MRPGPNFKFRQHGPTLVPGSFPTQNYPAKNIKSRTFEHDRQSLTQSDAPAKLPATWLPGWLEHKATGGQVKTKPAFKRCRNIAATISSTWSPKQRTQQIMDKESLNLWTNFVSSHWSFLSNKFKVFNCLLNFWSWFEKFVTPVTKPCFVGDHLVHLFGPSTIARPTSGGGGDFIIRSDMFSNIQN